MYVSFISANNTQMSMKTLKNISKKRKYILHKKHNFLGFFLLANYSFLVLGFVLSDKI